MNDATRVVRAGLPAPEQGEPFLPGPVFAAPFHLRGDPDDSEYVYTRYGNPTWTAYEQALGELEGGEATLFASGMAAIAAVLLPSLSRGAVFVLPSDCYISTRAIAREYLGPREVEVIEIPTAELTPDALPQRLALLWLESPSNPGLDVSDIAELAAAAHERSATVAVDNTFATPLGQRPLELGADLSVTSATKHLSGHHDLVLGNVTARDPARAEALRSWRTHTGGIAGPFEAWLAHRALSTLDLRLERGCANALAIAELLAGRDDLVSVRYPGLAGDPAHELATRQMTRFGTIVSFDVGREARAEAFLDAAELVAQASSFGGVHTIAERRARWKADAVPEGFIRLHAGCEDAHDLLADVEQALERS
jgi:cystathionine gamma-lyase